MARKRAAKKTQEAAESVPPEMPAVTQAAAEPPATIQAADETATGKTEPPAADVNPFPRVIKTAVLDDGYKIRLQQSQDRNEVQIKFGEGRTGDKPSDAVIDFIKAQEGPHGTRFHWNNDDRAWGMPIRDPIHDPRLLATREKARRIFDDVVKMVAQERGTGMER